MNADTVGLTVAPEYGGMSYCLSCAVNSSHFERRNGFFFYGDNVAIRLHRDEATRDYWCFSCKQIILFGPNRTKVWTNAPAAYDYDYSGVVQVGETFPSTGVCGPVEYRLVSIPNSELEHQKARYESGLYAVALEDEIVNFVIAGILDPKILEV